MSVEIKTVEQRHQEDLQRLRGLRPIDDDFMRVLFKENLPLAEYVLRILTNKPDLILTACVTQADMKRVTGARSICLDAYGTDSSGKKYDIEIQRADRGADPHRARYHSSVMDVENLDAGQEYKQLPDTYVIFITEKDFYGRGKPVYLIRNMNVTTGEAFEDGAYILYVNGEYRGSDSIGELMHDFNCFDPEKMQISMLREKSKYYKETEEGIAEMCRMMEDMRNEAAEEARIKTFVDAVNGIKRMFGIGNEKAIEAANVPAELRSAVLSALG